MANKNFYDKKQLYFCYGSNLNVAQMRKRCPKAVELCDATLPDYKLEFRGNSFSGVCTIRKAPGWEVVGGLWLISDECLKSLDRYEGYPTLYTRETVKVLTPYEKEPVRALTYIMTPGHRIAMPSTHYLRVCLDGYRDFGLSKRPMLKALAETEAVTNQKISV